MVQRGLKKIGRIAFVLFLLTTSVIITLILLRGLKRILNLIDKLTTAFFLVTVETCFFQKLSNIDAFMEHTALTVLSKGLPTIRVSFTDNFRWYGEHNACLFGIS